MQAFSKGPDADQVFFAELSYEGSKELYKRLNVKSLPFIFHWGAEAVAKEGRSIKISKASQVLHARRARMVWLIATPSGNCTAEHMPPLL